MKVEENKKIVKIIETTKGHIYSPYSNPDHKIKLTVFNEILTPQCSKVKSNVPIDMQHLNYHKQNPYSLQNTSIQWASIEHQLRQLINKNNISESELLVFESSNYNQKIPQIFNKFQIVKGYNYRLKLQSLNNLSQDKIALMTEQHVLKQIQMQFSLGNGAFKPGYIGEIQFQQIQSPVFTGIIRAYLNYAIKTKCPFVIDFGQKGQSTYDILFNRQNNQGSQIVNRMNKKIFILQSLLKSVKQQNNSLKNIIVYNLPIVLIMNKSSFQSYNHFGSSIQSLIEDYNITVGFKLLQYSRYNEKDGINQIIKLIDKYANNIIVSSGIKYKTDLILNHGQGLSLYYSNNAINHQIKILNLNSIQYMQCYLSPEKLNQVINLNVIELFDWKQKKQQIKIQIFWKCDTCNNDFSQTIKAFGKFGKQFCSIKCLKAYKF